MLNTTSGKWFQVTVGNIGNVYSGHSQKEAEKTFAEYKVFSGFPHGRASGENVALFVDNEIVQEFN